LEDASGSKAKPDGLLRRSASARKLASFGQNPPVRRPASARKLASFGENSAIHPAAAGAELASFGEIRAVRRSGSAREIGFVRRKFRAVRGIF